MANGYAYVAGGGGGLQIVDVSDPVMPSLCGNYDPTNGINDVVVAGDYAFASNSSDGLRILDVSDPMNPCLEVTVDTPGYAKGLYMADDRIYIADSDFGGLQIVDVSNPLMPEIVDSYLTPGQAAGVFVEGSHTYVADCNSVMIFTRPFSGVTDGPRTSIRARAYPTPARGVICIQGVLPAQMHLRVGIFNTLGRRIATLANRSHAAGDWVIHWNASTVPSGIYHCRITAGDEVFTRRVTVVR
ncbi:MAG: T9SS type A sorting domain-containing protein [Candidatus Eisenbacteria sp.]|nr:T9SS type A sorting domain-containing protein [Candidatus Eisenbacteria bacterium]